MAFSITIWASSESAKAFNTWLNLEALNKNDSKNHRGSARVLCFERSHALSNGGERVTEGFGTKEQQSLSEDFHFQWIKLRIRFYKKKKQKFYAKYNYACDIYFRFRPMLESSSGLGHSRKRSTASDGVHFDLIACMSLAEIKTPSFVSWRNNYSNF